jgi:transcriptional regulator with XRE-family HTH domain
MVAEDSVLRLARRLRELRERRWPGRPITQKQLADALVASVPLISSWEHRSRPVVPPEKRLGAYATFFATERSVDHKGLLEVDELSEDEKAERARLLDDLVELRADALGAVHQSVSPSGLWNFPPEQDITIVCALLPEAKRGDLPFTDPDDPDYVEYYSYGDLDSMLELYGYIRATCPENVVLLKHSKALTAEDISSNLILLGGVDWNDVTDDVLGQLATPIEQIDRPTDNDAGGFRVNSDGEQRTIAPRLEKRGDRRELIEDVAHFYRGPNPYNKSRTVTIFNGTFGRGTLGAVRSTIDRRYRARNEEYVSERLYDNGVISLLMRVRMFKGKVITPDWTAPGTCLHEWSEDSGE